jgi:hypothetical protein
VEAVVHRDCLTVESGDDRRAQEIFNDSSSVAVILDCERGMSMTSCRKGHRSFP